MLMVGGTDNGRQKTRNHGYDVIVGGRAAYWLLRSPSQTCHAKPKTQINRRRTLKLLLLVGCLPQAAWPVQTSLRKVRTPALQQIKERGALPMIDRRYPSAINVAAISGLHCRALLRLSGYKADSLIAKRKKRAELSERLMYEQSHRDYLRSGYLHHRLPVMGC